MRPRSRRRIIVGMVRLWSGGWIIFFLNLCFLSQSQDVPILCDPECQNGGVCELGFGIDETETGCSCPEWTAGEKCETTIRSNMTTEPCFLECMNEGECVNVQGGETCKCLPGTSGLQCEVVETTFPSCAPDICPMETPTNGQEAHVPSSQDSVLCNLVCQNGGQCEVVTGSSNNETECSCVAGFSGNLCETAVPIEETSSQGPLYESPCDLECQNGGVCGSSDGSGVGKDICICPPDTSGDLCENVDSVPCGLNVCYHGSQCIQASDGGFYCDCTVIVDSEKHYAGNFCQYEVITYCDDGKDYFCLNGGTCRDEGNGDFSCECSDEWSGSSCEFESVNRDHDQNSCKLNCLNGGKCKKGAKYNSQMNGLSTDMEPVSVSENMEHCECPKTFAGMRCEHRYEDCGNGEHMCLHGSKCVPPQDEQRPKWTCKCDESSRNTCQHHRSSVCTSSDADSSIYRGMTSLIYCVNDGVCRIYEQDGQQYPACKCPPQYSGPHCEFLGYVGQGVPLNAEKKSAGTIFAIFFSCILVVFLMVFACTRMKGQSSRDKAAIIQAAHTEDETPMMEAVDFEGVMEDVELL